MGVVASKDLHLEGIVLDFIHLQRIKIEIFTIWHLHLVLRWHIKLVVLLILPSWHSWHAWLSWLTSWHSWHTWLTSWHSGLPWLTTWHSRLSWSTTGSTWPSKLLMRIWRLSIRWKLSWGILLLLLPTWWLLWEPSYLK